MINLEAVGKLGECTVLDASLDAASARKLPVTSHSRPFIEENLAAQKKQFERFIEFGDGKGVLTNNADWLTRFGFIEFLRDVGKHFRLGEMLAKESVKSRLNSDAGISYTEFSYMLLQAYDFLHLFDEEGCTFQAGGSDQWGNIVAGIELIRKLRGKQAYGIVFPLLLDSSGHAGEHSDRNSASG